MLGAIGGLVADKGIGIVTDLFGYKQKYQNQAQSLARLSASGAPSWFQSAAVNRTYYPESKPLGDKQRDLMQVASAVETLAGGNPAMSERQWVSVANQLGLDVPPGLSMEDSWTLTGGGSGGGSADAGGFGGGGSWAMLAAAALVLYLVLRR